MQDPKMADTGQPHQIDLHVGRRLRQRRIAVGLTQEKLGRMLGITFQQVQKYERGFNRIVASRLYELSRALEVPLSYFFEGLDEEEGAARDPEYGPAGGERPSERETLMLLRAFRALSDSEVRHRVINLVEALSGLNQEEEEPEAPAQQRQG